MALSAAMVLGLAAMNGVNSRASLIAGSAKLDEPAATASATPGVSATPQTSATPQASATPEATATPEPTATTAPSMTPAAEEQPATVGAISLNLTKVNRMVGKSFTLIVSSLPADRVRNGENVKFVADKEGIVKISGDTISSDFTEVKATVKLVKKGKTNISVMLGDEVLPCSCEVKVVPKMSKADFGMYNVQNFLNYCSAHSSWKWVWSGEWGTPKGKYGSTYRGIKIGRSLSDVEEEYGELTLKKCKRATSGKKGDPFLYEKKFNTSSKKLKVSKYADLTYGSYRIRVYFTSKNKVFGFIMVKGFTKITKAALIRDSHMSMI